MVLDDFIEVVLALAYLHAHIDPLAFLLVLQDALGYLFGLDRQELLAVRDVPQQLFAHSAVVPLLRPFSQLS